MHALLRKFILLKDKKCVEIFSKVLIVLTLTLVFKDTPFTGSSTG